MCVCIFTVALKISNVSKKAKALKKQSERHVARSWWCSWWRWRWPLPPPLTSIIYICSCVQAAEAIVRVRVMVRLKKVFLISFVAYWGNGHRVQPLLLQLHMVMIPVTCCNVAQTALTTVSSIVLIVWPRLWQLVIFMAVDFLEEQINFPRPRRLTYNYTNFNVAGRVWHDTMASELRKWGALCGKEWVDVKNKKRKIRDNIFLIS